MRFRKKPVEIEAIQFTGDNFHKVRDFVGRVPDHDNLFGFGFRWMMPADKLRYPDGIVALVWDKLHSTWVGVKLNQWIIQGVKGEYYPCDPEVMEATYDEVPNA